MTTQTDSLDECIKKFVPSKQHKKILDALELEARLTRDHLHDCTGISVSSLCARLKELEMAKRIEVFDTEWSESSKRHVNCYRLYRTYAS